MLNVFFKRLMVWIWRMIRMTKGYDVKRHRGRVLAICAPMKKETNVPLAGVDFKTKKRCIFSILYMYRTILKYRAIEAELQ